jgi:hypothetical protein
MASEKTKIVNAALNMLRQLLTAKRVPGNDQSRYSAQPTITRMRSAGAATFVQVV